MRPKNLQNRKKTNKKPKQNLNFYAKYSSLAFQMIIIMLAGVFGGMKLDKLISLEFPVFTIVLTILSVFAALYFAIKDLLK